MKHNLESMLKRVMEHVDLEKPNQFLDHVYLGYTQRECKLNENFVDEYRKMFESLTPQELFRSYLVQEM